MSEEASPIAAPASTGAKASLPLLMGLLWLLGVGLRLPVLTVPPTIPLLHTDPALLLNKTGVGVLSALPLLLFAWGAMPGSLLIVRIGPRRALIAGLFISTLGAGLRSLAPEILTLYAATAVMGFGIAVMQPSMPPLVRAWLPSRVNFATAVYSNGLVLGQLIVVWTSIPFVLPLLGGSWRLDYAIWCLPGAVTVLLLLAFAPPAPPPIAATAARPVRWMPPWRSPLLWKLGFIVGGINTLYFATNAFLPDYLTYLGRPEQISSALTGLNFGPLAASLIMLGIAQKLSRRAFPFIVAALIMLAGVGGITFLGASWASLSAGLVGFGNVAALILAFALPAQLCPPEDVPRTSAGMFLISYNCAVVAMVAGGLSWDLTGSPYIALALIACGALAIICLAPRVDFRQGAIRS